MGSRSVVGPVANPQCFIEQILPANGKAHQAGKAFRGVVFPVHMDVDATGAIGKGPSLAQQADDFLQVLHILIL